MAEQSPELWRGLEEKVVMVTGASSGIGLEFFLDLAKAGCRLIASARRIQRLDSLCKRINQLPTLDSTSPRAVAVEMDVSSAAKSIEASVGRAWEAFGRIDVLINNAGVRGNVKSSLDLPEDDWNSTFRTNVTGTWLVSKYVAIRMRDAKVEGSIINISSAASVNRGEAPGGVAYCASKAAANCLTKVMALELGAYKIKVNAIAPGLFKSEITQSLLEKEWIPTVARKIVPLLELGSVNPALTSLVRYLIHDSSHYITGNIYIVDAGGTLPGVPILSSL